MGALVALYAGKEGRVKTWDLWQGFGYKEHRTLKMVIFKNRAACCNSAFRFTHS